MKYKVLLCSVSAGNTIFQCILLRAHLSRSPVQETLKFSPAHVCLIISPSRPTFCPSSLTDMQSVDAKQGNEGLTYRVSVDNIDIINIPSTLYPLNIHPTFYPQSTYFEGNMYSHGYYVVTLWDRSWERVGPKLCGFYADNQLLGCGDYVDFVPRKLPHIVCPAIVQQHPMFIY